MKVFAYDPTTGKRGELLDNVQIGTWAGGGIRHLINTGKLKDLGWIQPSDNHQCNYTIHEDAGISDRDGVSVSYRRENQWIAFCIGNWGVHGNPESYRWEWVILPSTEALKLAIIENSTCV